MGKPVSLTSEQQAQFVRSSFALDDPESFTRIVRERLATMPEIGDGLVFRVCQSLQPRYFTASPDRAENGNHRAQQLRKIR